jgi:hypothetical protein
MLANTELDGAKTQKMVANYWTTMRHIPENGGKLPN